MLDEMKEVEKSEHSGAAVETKSSSGCLITNKKISYDVEGVLGFSDLPSRSSFNSSKEKKRPRVVLSDTESDELPEPAIRQKFHKFGNASVSHNSFSIRNKDYHTEKRVNDRLDVSKLDESDEMNEIRITNNVNDHRRRLILHTQNGDQKESGSGSSRNTMEDDECNIALSVSNENKEEDFEEPVRLQRKDKFLMLNKARKSTNRSEAGDMIKHRTRVLDEKKSNLSPNIREKQKPNKKRTAIQSSPSAKVKESKNKRGSCTEKQLLREKIKKMLFDAGWKIDYRPRRTRDYLDSVYISPGGTAYWSITKAYDALKKEEKDKSKTGGDFTPLPNEILNKLTRQTRKKLEREIEKNQSNGKKSSKRVKTSFNSSERRLKEANNESSEYSSDDFRKREKAFNNSPLVQGIKSGIIGRRTLLVRDSENGSNPENKDSYPYSEKCNILSWLIDSGTVCINEEVKYMNLKRTRVMEEGWITNDGIHCKCCSKIITVSRFELHAGSKLGQPFENIFIKSGQSLVECMIDAWNKQEDSKRKGFYKVNVDGGDPNDDTCGLCGDGGDLICCDGCPSTFHLGCLDIKMLPQGDWHCPNCACKYCDIVGGYSSKARGKTGNSLLTCHLCEKKYHKSCSREMDDRFLDSKDFNLPFCGQKCREVYRRFQKLLWIKHELDSGFSWSLIHRSDPLPEISSFDYSQRAECNSKVAIALSLMDECFLPIDDTRSGINLIHNVVYNCGSNFSRLNYSGFFTAVLEKGDEMICAASIRIHGSQLAEMPFIGTRHTYRRQGMCRRLLHAIESALSSLKVEKLVIPAIEEHMQTWTNVFNFRPLEESHKQEMKSFNMLVFAGTDMLQKPLLKQPKGNQLSAKGLRLGNKRVEVETYNKPLTKKSELNNTAIQNDDHTENPSGIEIQPSLRNSDAHSNSVVTKDPSENGNKTTALTPGADSDSKVETIDVQNDKETAAGITDSSEPQLQVIVKEPISVDVHSDSIVQENGNLSNELSPKVPYKEAHSESKVKENDVRDGMDDSDRNRNV